MLMLSFSCCTNAAAALLHMSTWYTLVTLREEARRGERGVSQGVPLLHHLVDILTEGKLP